MRRLPTPAWLPVAMILALLAGACASTSGQRATGDARDRSETSAPGADTSGPEEDERGHVDDRETDGSAESGATGSDQGADDVAGDPAVGTDAQGAAAGPGDGSRVKIGIEIIQRASFQQLGVSQEMGDRERAARAVVDAINAQGGMGGREADLVVHLRDDTQGTFESQAQASCSKFAEDHGVFAVVSGQAGGQHTLVDCLDRHGIPTVVGSIELYDGHLFDRYPHLYAPAKLSASRWDVWIHSLVDQGFFQGDTRIGLVRHDIPVGERVSQRIASALEERGLTLTEEAAIRQAGSISELSSTSAETNNAILRFRSQGVNRVLFASSGDLPFFWLQQAESQGYRPRYGFTSEGFLNFTKDNAPARQLEGARGIGWWPIYDVMREQDPGGRAGEERCREMFRGAGIGFPDRLSEGYALGDCDMLLFLESALAGMTELHPDDFRSSVAGLGGSFGSAATFEAFFAPGSRDGARAFREIAFDERCGCWTYVSGPRRAR